MLIDNAFEDRLRVPKEVRKMLENSVRDVKRLKAELGATW